ncbi:SusC/RagA family TonB-linked outer membrane protein [Larkinella sp. GY13]|uniref:SusC/RagA family TonB-linked outer membrane protein n=1 Tax=Larkinella sp. GY13 TaxID=3453720 RepID=UPI003EE8B26B
MRTLIYLKSLLVLANLSFSVCPAQTLATSRIQQRTHEQKTAPVKLSQLLRDIKSHYSVDVLYADRVVRHIQVLPSTVNWSLSLEQNLTKLLQPHNLAFSKQGSGSYVIFALPKEAKTAPALKLLPEMPEAGRLEMLSVPASDNHPAIHRPLVAETAPKDVPISGNVTDEKGEGLPGVSVVVKGTQRGATTDVSGKYSLSVPNVQATLVFSFVGYVSKEITVGNQTQINVSLQTDTKALEEVVVVGYGTQKKVNMTGAVSTIDLAKVAESRPITSVSSSLYGLAPGLSVNQGNGRPGGDGASLLIRGSGTLNNASPLVIVDGVESNMNNLNPQDIETVSILKDAASAAIYGSRAANGVILITTKKGKEGTMKINYNGYVAAQKATRLVETVSDYVRHMELYNESQQNTTPGVSPIFPQSSIDLWKNDAGKNPLMYPNTDWRDLFDQNVISQNHNVSINGGTEKIKFFSSFGYLNNPGIIENTGFRRYSGRVNLEAKVKPYLTLGLLASGTNSSTDIGTDALDNNSAFRWSASTSPAMVYRSPDGRYGASNSPDGSGVTNNALATVNARKGDINQNRLATRFFGVFNPVKGLTLEGSFNYEQTGYLKEQQPVFLDRWSFRTNSIVVAGTGRTYALNRSEQTARKYMDGIIRYQTTFGNGLNLHAMVGASQEYYKSSWFEAQKYDLTDPSLTVLNAATIDADASGTASDWGMNSYFGRLNLGWKEKYLLEANVRYDGSSRFRAGDTRWGMFPSISAGWRISEEPFLKGIDWLDNLKLRASYGALGNNSIGNYDYQALYASSNYVLNGTLQTGFAQTAIANSIITWESTYVTNLGFDFGFFRNRLSGSLELFDKDTRNILINLPAPNVRGTASLPQQNAARVRNRGVELALNWNDRIGEVRYQIGGNMAFINNEVTKFKGDERTISNENLLQEGLPANVLFVLATDRILQTESDMALVQQLIDKAPVNASGQKVNPFAAFGTPKLGDLLYKDLNGDGIINNDDKYVVGYGTSPRFTYGLNFGLQWKGFDFSCLLQGIGGFKDYWLDDWRTPTPANLYLINKEVADGRWTPGRTDASYPRLLLSTNTINRVISDFWVVDKSYLRVKNLQFGYRLPKSITQKMALEGLRVYCSLENFLTLTNYKGFDPEIQGGNSGIDSFNYPTMKQSTLGLSIDF